MKLHYPEIYKHVPESIEDKNGYWFDSSNHAIRISILKQAIKETKS